MGGRGPYRRWPYEQVAVHYLPVVDQSTGPGFDPAGLYFETPRPPLRYSRAYWQGQYRPEADVSTAAPFDPPDLPATPLPRGQARYGRPQWQQRIPQYDQSVTVFDPPDLPVQITPRPPLRPNRVPWYQHIPTVDVSEPALDLEAIPTAPPPRAQFRPLARPWWAQYQPHMDTSAVVVFDPPDLPQQITPRPPLRANRVPWMQYRPQVAPDRGIRPLLHAAAYDNSDQTVQYSTVTINSIGPEAILWVGLQGAAGTPPGIAVSGCGLTWTEELTDVQNVRRIYLFSGVGDFSSPGALTLSLTDLGGGTSAVGLDYVVIGLQGADPADLVVQTNSVVATSGTSTSVGLAAPADALNRPFFYMRHQQAEDTTPRANWTELSDTQGGTPSTGNESQWRDDAFETTASATWTSSVQNLAAAAEIRALGEPVEELPPFFAPGRPQTRPGRSAWQQYRPVIDVSEPALDLQALPSPEPPRAQFRYAGRPQWVQFRPTMDASAAFDPPDLPVQITPRPPLRPTFTQRAQYRARADASTGPAFDPPDLARQITPYPPLRPNRQAWRQFRPAIDVSEPDLAVPAIRHPRVQPHRHPIRQARYQYRPKADQGTVPVNAAGEVDSFLTIGSIYEAVMTISIGTGAVLTLDNAIAGTLEIE